MLIIWFILYVLIPVVIGTLVAVLMYRYAHWSLGWAVASGAAVAFIFWSNSWWVGLPDLYANIASMVFAVALGGFFVLASRRQGRRIRTAIVAGVLAFTAAVALTFPVETHAVKLDMPSPR